MKLFIAFLAVIICCSAQISGYTALTAAQIKASAPVQALIQLGLKEVISLGQAKNQFHSNQFNVTKINSVYQQAVSGGFNEKIDVNYTNAKKEEVRATFQGFYNTTSKAAKINSLAYKVQYPTVASANTTSNTTTNSTTPANNATTGVNGTAPQTNSTVSSLLNFGFNAAIQASIAAGKIPKGTYTVTKVNSITPKGATINFNVLAKDTTGTIIALAFIVEGDKLLAFSSAVEPST